MRSRKSDALLELKDTQADGVRDEVAYQQHRMSAGNRTYSDMAQIVCPWGLRDL